VIGPPLFAPPDVSQVAIDVAPLTSPQASAVAAVRVDELDPTRPRFSTTRVDDHRLVGTLVHRLFQLRRGQASSTQPDAIAARVPALIRPGEAVDVVNVDALCARAASAYLTLAERADVREMLESGTCYYEVPFTFIDRSRGPTPARRAPAFEDSLSSRVAAGAIVVRGRIDCVVDRGDRLSILEFKTGGPRPEHDEQISMYVDALRIVFPSREIDARVIYP
jgi:ATP-dependent exoDNAse (exonuclease V) beta subunit